MHLKHFLARYILIRGPHASSTKVNICRLEVVDLLLSVILYPKAKAGIKNGTILKPEYRLPLAVRNESARDKIVYRLMKREALESSINYHMAVFAGRTKIGEGESLASKF